MNLRPFHLAAENGQYEVLEFLYRIDNKQVDILSLHNAAAEGNSKIVKMLLDKGASDSCLPCNGTLYWISEDAIRFQSNKDTTQNMMSFLSWDFEKIKFYNKISEDIELSKNKTKSQFSEYINDAIMGKKSWYSSFHDISFEDDWHLLTCETALTASVKNKHMKVVKTLLANSNATLNCKDYSGRIPLMTAIIERDTEMFEYLLKFDNNYYQKCQNMLNFTQKDKLKISDSDMDILKRGQCPPGASISHLLASYGNAAMLKRTLQNSKIKWDDLDINNATSIHYAMCHNNEHFIFNDFQSKYVKTHLLFRTLNGSTPYHSSSAYASDALQYINSKFQHRIPDVKDFIGRSVLHYGIIGHIPSQYHRSWFILKSFPLLKNLRHNLSHVDDNGQNFLHHVCKSGAYYVFDNAIRNFSNKSLIEMLLQKDKNGFNPLEVAFDSMLPRKHIDPIKIDNNCTLDQIFTYKCELNYSYLLNPHELCVLSISRFLSTHGQFEFLDVWKLVISAAEKSRLYPILILKTFASLQFKGILVSSDRLQELLSKYEGPYLETFILTDENALKCNSSHHSPLHTIIANIQNKYWSHSTTHFLSTYLSSYSSDYLDSCFDKEGLNLLHRAAMGGHLIALKYLKEKGMVFSKPTEKNDTALEIVVKSSPYLIEGMTPSYYHTKGFKFYVLEYQTAHRVKQTVQHVVNVNFDKAAVFILSTVHKLAQQNLTPNTILRNKLCKVGSNNLGLLHLAAIKGMLELIKYSARLYGNDILDCQNVDNVTLYQLAAVANQTMVIEWLQGLPKPKVRYDPLLWKVISYKLFENFQNFDWICGLHYHHRFSKFNIHINQKCLQPKFKAAPLIILRGEKNDSLIHDVNLKLYSFAMQPLLMVWERLDIFRKHANYSAAIRLCIECEILVASSQSPEVCKTCWIHVFKLAKYLKSYLKQVKVAIGSFKYIFNDFAIFGFSDNKQYMEIYSNKTRNSDDYKRNEFSQNMLYTAYFSKFKYLSVLSQHQKFHNMWLKSKLSPFANISDYQKYTLRFLKPKIDLIKKTLSEIQHGEQ